ncbi:MAG: hypothetical protein ACKOAL_06575, partial [Chthoniobacterales bacterium]
MRIPGSRPRLDLGIVRPAAQAVIALLVLLAAPRLSWSAELSRGWREEVATLGSGSFPAPPAMDTRYVFGWSGIEAAEAKTSLRRGADGIWTANVTGGTKGWARTLWKLDADYQCEFLEKDWKTQRMKLTENYRAYRTEEKAEFLPGGVRSWRE